MDDRRRNPDRQPFAIVLAVDDEYARDHGVLPESLED
jgi:hypothetical protein